MPLPLGNEPRAPGAPARSWRDWALVGVFCGLAVIKGLTRPTLPGGPAAVLLVFLLAPTLLWRRSQPLLMVAIAFPATFVAPFLTGGVPPEARSLALLILLPYSLLRWGSGREIAGGVAIMAAKVVASVAAGQMSAGTALAGAAVIFA